MTCNTYIRTKSYCTRVMCMTQLKSMLTKNKLLLIYNILVIYYFRHEKESDRKCESRYTEYN